MVYDAFVVALNVVLSAVYAAVGWTVLHRRPDGPGRLAASAFAAWWLLLAFANLGSPIDALVRAAGGWSLPFYLAWTQIVLLVIVAALACLLYYLIYLFSGRRGAWVPVAVGYIAYYAAILAYLAYADPVALKESGTSTSLEYARPLEDHWSTLVLGALLVVPPLLGALAYFSLIFRVDGRTQRFRIATISIAFILWFATSLVVGQFTDVAERPWWPIASAMLALGASLAVLAAFRPPDWIRRRLHVEGFGEAA